MEDSVTLILGEWSCSDTGEWRFVVRNGEMARCVAVKKDSSFSDLEREVERVFGVKRTETSIVLSFWFAGETTVFTQTKMPPVLIKSDVEYALFKEKKRESFGLHMYVTLKKLGCDIEESMEEEHANGYCGGDGLYEIDIDEVEEMISDTQLLAYVEEIEAAHKERMVEVGGGRGQIMAGQKRSGPESSSPGLVDKNLLRDVIVGGQTALVGGCDKGKAIVILEDNEVNGSVSVDVGEILRDENEENLMDMSSNYDEEPDYNFDEWTERINNDYPPDWDPYNGLGEKEVEDVALGVMGEMGVYEVGGPSGEHEREVGEQITERQSLVDEIVPIGFSLGLEEEIGVLGREDENVGEQAIISSFMEEDMFGVIDVNDPLLLNDAPPVHDNMRGAPSDERNMDLKRASDAIYIGRIFANKAELHKFLSVYAMQRLFSFRVLKSDKGRAIVRCVDKKCDWRIYAVNHKDSENLEIRTARLKHTCDVSYRSRYSEKATAKILADLLCSKYANGKKGPRACELPEMVLAELNVTISYMKAWNTKELAIAAARGNEEESYKFLATNVKHKFSNEGLAGIVSKAARAFTVGDFRWWWREIESRKPACASYLLNIGLPHWTLSHFPGMRYNIMSSNISESLNAALQKAVDYPIVSMVEFIRAMLMRWFWCRRTVARKAKTRCTPEIEELLIDHFKESVDCAVLSASDWIYQVNDGNGIVFTVDLEKKSCTCRVFDVLQVPCSHALAAVKVRDVDIYSLVGEWYFVEPWMKKYEQIVMPVPKERDSDVPEEIQEVVLNPPKTKRGGGRPRKVRIPSQGEKHRVRTFLI
ncbi:unnamed protein product [Arabidopsis arenosa]|uniref:SWIM-type domain-containing protein n=1 Tax=Arabidopsis arenosa TaxID=38785 RepID=A0A8S2A8G4_ARAAE|nr:unnamed protein product [Arabidopsis arenosa]